MVSSRPLRNTSPSLNAHRPYTPKAFRCRRCRTCRGPLLRIDLRVPARRYAAHRPVPASPNGARADRAAADLHDPENRVTKYLHQSKWLEFQRTARASSASCIGLPSGAVSRWFRNRRSPFRLAAFAALYKNATDRRALWWVVSARSWVALLAVK